MPQRPRHQNGDFELILKRAEQQGWIVKKPGRYFKLYCPCPDKHLKTMHNTPSDPNYLRNWLNFMKKKTCWEDQ